MFHMAFYLFVSYSPHSVIGKLVKAVIFYVDYISIKCLYMHLIDKNSKWSKAAVNFFSFLQTNFIKYYLPTVPKNSIYNGVYNLPPLPKI